MLRQNDLRKMDALGMGVALCIEAGQARRRSFVRYRDPVTGRVWAVDAKAGEYAELTDDELDPIWQRLMDLPQGEVSAPGSGLELEPPASLASTPTRPAMLLYGR